MKIRKYTTFLSALSLATINHASAQGSIRNDDPNRPSNSQSHSNTNEGNEMIEYLKDVSPQQVSVQCMKNKMCISIEKQFLKDKEITSFYDKLELRNITDKCSNTYINFNTDDDWESATHVELCTTDGFLSCGTRMEMNDTHVSYINQIITKNEVNSDRQLPGQLFTPLIREYVIPWHCIYPLEYVVDLETDDGNKGNYVPEISPLEYVTVRSPLLHTDNTYSVFMQIFEDNDYRKPFTEVPVLSNTDKLFVEAKMVGPKDASIQLVNCWATPFGGQTRQEIADYKFDIIQDYCITEGASDSIAANIIKNGRSHSSQFEANVFKYSSIVDTDQVYLHCNVRVCFEENGQCDVTTGFCDGNSRRKRKKRALSDYGADSAELALDPSITTIHAGPFKLLSNDAYLVEGQQVDRDLELARFEIIETHENSESKLMLGLPMMFIYCFIAIIVIIITLIFGIIFLVLRRRSSNQKQAKTLTDKTLQVIDQTNGQTFVVTQNGNTVLNTKATIAGSNGKTLSPIQVTIPGAAPIAQGRSSKQSYSHMHQSHLQNYHTPHPMPSNASDSDRYSRVTHQTHLPNSSHSYTTASDQSERAAYAESTDCSSVPGSAAATSRTPSTSSDVRPIVAKVKQDSYYRLQGHSNNLINAYSKNVDNNNNSSNLSEKSREKRSQRTERSDLS